MVTALAPPVSAGESPSYALMPPLLPCAAQPSTS